jgi:hypothetical protein
MKSFLVSSVLLAFVTGTVACSSPTAPTQTSSLPPAGSGDGVVNLRNSSNGLSFQEVCLSAAGTYTPTTNGTRVPIPAGRPWIGASFTPICVRGLISVGNNFRIGADSDARFTPGRASLSIDGAIFAVTIGAGTTNLIYPTSFQ